MNKTNIPDAVYSEAEQLSMLSAMCDDDKRPSADPLDYGCKMRSGSSLAAMDVIQVKNPGAELYFLFGVDKLKTFVKWKIFDEFVRKYRIIVCKREGSDPEAEITKTTMLRQHEDTFVILPSPAGIGHISSTTVWERPAHGESVEDYLHPAVRELIRK